MYLVYIVHLIKKGVFLFIVRFGAPQALKNIDPNAYKKY